MQSKVVLELEYFVVEHVVLRSGAHATPGSMDTRLTITLYIKLLPFALNLFLI